MYKAVKFDTDFENHPNFAWDYVFGPELEQLNQEDFLKNKNLLEIAINLLINDVNAPASEPASYVLNSLDKIVKGTIKE